MRLHMKLETTTTQPQPPSGGRGTSSRSSSWMTFGSEPTLNLGVEPIVIMTGRWPPFFLISLLSSITRNTESFTMYCLYKCKSRLNADAIKCKRSSLEIRGLWSLQFFKWAISVPMQLWCLSINNKFVTWSSCVIYLHVSQILTQISTRSRLL